ncbi:MAG TPA: sigma-70 family RNA polymerase sigma factor, partial [Gemmatimonadaceae bacterium]
SEADDAVQEGWLRLSRADTSDVSNMSGWLTTVVARVCLDHLRSRESRREESLEVHAPESFASGDGANDPQRELELADSMSLALLVVLETLAPAERVAFVLHDMFDLPFDQIAPIVGRTPATARQLASRARRRVQGADATASASGDYAGQREIVDAFLAASRNGEFDALLALLDPDVVLRGGATVSATGADAVAKTFSGRAKAARPALIDGVLGAVWAPDGVPRVVFAFTTQNGQITSIDLIGDAERLAALDLVILRR